MNTDRVTADGAVRTASATIAWFRCDATDGQDPDRRIDGAGRRRREGSVRPDQDLRVARASGQLAGQLERVAEVAARAAGLDAVERLADAPEVGRLVDHDPGRPVGGDHADLAAGRQVAQRVERRGLGRLQAGSGVTSVAAMLADVSRTSDDVPGEPGRSLQERPCGEQREDRHEQQLEEQQEAPAQPLPRGVGLDVGDQARPQQRRRHDRLVASQLEQVHREDGRHEEQAEQRERGGERHRR